MQADRPIKRADGRRTLNAARISGVLSAASTIHGNVGSMTLNLSDLLVIDGSVRIIRVGQPMQTALPVGGSVGMLSVAGAAKVIAAGQTFLIAGDELYVQ